MNRMSAVVACVIGVSAAASAKVTTQWYTDWEVLNNGGGQLPAGAIAQLIFSPSATMSTPLGGTPFAMTGDNVLLGFFTFSGIDGYIDPSANFTPVNGYWEGGYNVSYGVSSNSPVIIGAGVFTRAFNSGTLPTFYGQGGLDSSLNEQFVAPNADISNIASSSNFQLTTPIPEPGVGVLVLAGAAVAIFRRRRTDA